MQKDYIEFDFNQDFKLMSFELIMKPESRSKQMMLRMNHQNKDIADTR